SRKCGKFPAAPAMPAVPWPPKGRAAARREPLRQRCKRGTPNIVQRPSACVVTGKAPPAASAPCIFFTASHIPSTGEAGRKALIAGGFESGDPAACFLSVLSFSGVDTKKGPRI